MKQISIIIPAYNEEASIGRLLDSIEKISYPKEMYEVIVVSDGSTDGTARVVQQYPNVRLVNLTQNVGRYECRKAGAKNARYEHLLFVDAHSTVDPEILSALNQIDAKVVTGHVLDAGPQGPFETFYWAIRRLIFSKFLKALNRPHYLTSENFDSMPKGTTVFYVEKELLFSTYDDLATVTMGKDASDDTKLLRAVVAREPIVIHPNVKISYFSRSTTRARVKHLYERGPKFVDYYFNPSLRNFWMVIAFPLLLLAAAVYGLFFWQGPLIFKLAGLVGLDLGITLLLSRSVREFFTIAWVMPVCVVVFYAGIVWGIVIKLLAWLGLGGRKNQPG